MEPLKLIGQYINGNYTVKIYNDGTKVRILNSSEDTEFIPEFPESIDLTVTEYCDGGCDYCYAGCSTQGQHCDFDKYEHLLDSIHPYTELAINGNDLSHPGLIPFLEKMKERNVLVNVTVSQLHFIKYASKLHDLCQQELIKGLGVSLWSADETLLSVMSHFENIVIHTISGIVTPDDLRKLANHNQKILILGYKELGRGKSFYRSCREAIEENKKELREALPEMFTKFKVVSFDNLALKQLDVESLLPKEQFEEIYMGDDAHYTFFMNLVQDKFAESSLSENLFNILGKDVNECFAMIRNPEYIRSRT